MTSKFAFFITLLFLGFENTRAQDSLMLDKDRHDTINYDERSVSTVFRSVHLTPEPKYFIPVKIFQPASFNSTSFLQMVFLDSIEFNKMTSFSGATFTDGTEALDVTFNDYCDFTSAIFTKGVDFTRTKFKYYTDFSGCTFLSTVDFSQAEFSKPINFTSLQVSPATQIIFSGTILPDTLNFSFNTQKLISAIDLTAARFVDSGELQEKPHYVILFKTDISQLHLDYIHFRLLIPDSIQVPDEIHQHRISDDEKESMYEGLLNNFSLHGQKESYRRLDIEYQRFKYHRNWWTVPVAWAQRFWWNFGYDKELVFLWTIIFFLVFTTINYFFLFKLNEYVYTVDRIPATSEGISKRRRYWYSFVYTALIFFKVTLNTDKLKFNHIWGTIYVMVMYASGLVCLAYIANFIIQK